MLKIKNKIFLTLLLLLFISISCKEPKTTTTKEVLVPILCYDNIESRVDSIVLEYTDIDSITQFVKRTYYTRNFAPYSFQYKLINKKTKAYIELPCDTIKSLYLNTDDNNIVFIDFGIDVIPKYLKGSFEYVTTQKDTIKETVYHIFRGRDFTFENIVYCYFDSAFHLKKIYSADGKNIFSVK